MSARGMQLPIAARTERGRHTHRPIEVTTSGKAKRGVAGMTGTAGVREALTGTQTVTEIEDSSVHGLTIAGGTGKVTTALADTTPAAVRDPAEIGATGRTAPRCGGAQRTSGRRHRSAATAGRVAQRRRRHPGRPAVAARRSYGPAHQAEVQVHCAGPVSLEIISVPYHLARWHKSADFGFARIVPRAASLDAC